MSKDAVPLRLYSCDSISAPTIAFVMMVRAAAIMVAPAPVAVIAPMAASVVHDRRRGIVTRRLIDHRRGRCSPAKRVDIDVDMDVSVRGGACRQRERDNSK